MKILSHFLEKFIENLQERLPDDLIEGVYLYGSVALDAFNEKKSDIDFIVLLKRPTTRDEIEAIREVHGRMNEQSEYGNRMDGMYIQVEHVGKTNEHQPPYPYFAEGKLDIGHWDINHITWWILKTRGIHLQGRPIAQLSLSTEWEDVLKTMDYNINEYWLRQTKEINNFLSDEMIDFTVSTICRIICTFEKQEILSKEGALLECLNILPKRWNLLLEECLRVRRESHLESLFTSDDRRAESCLDFILHAHRLCNEKMLVRSK